MPTIQPELSGARSWCCFFCRVLQLWHARQRADSARLAMDRRVASICDRLEIIFLLQPPRQMTEFISFETRLGQGAFATVFRGRPTALGLATASDLQANKDYAVKHISRQRKGFSEELGRSLLEASEERHMEFVDAFKGCHAFNCVQLLAIFIECEGDLFQVMELLEGPDLFDYLNGRSLAVAEADAALLTRQMLTAVHFFHGTVGAVHRDIKPENFGFVEPIKHGQPLPVLKLFDVGLAWVLPEPVTEATASEVRKVKRAGTWLYMAPETWEGFTGPPSDIWAIGLIAYLLLSLQMPFGLLSWKGRHSPDVVVREEPLTFSGKIWKSVSEAPQQLLVGMLRKDPAKRATAASALAEAWVQQARVEEEPEASSCGGGLRESLSVPLLLPEKHSCATQGPEWERRDAEQELHLPEKADSPQPVWQALLRRPECQLG